MNNLTIKVSQYLLFNNRVNILIWKICIIRCNIQISRIFFSKTVERCRLFCCRTIECPLNRNNTTHSVIFHIIRENHQLCNIQKSPKFFIRKSLLVHSLAFCNHTAVIIRLLYFNKYKWKSIYKQCNIRSKFILVTLTGELGGKMICIILWILKIHQSNRRNRR